MIAAPLDQTINHSLAQNHFALVPAHEVAPLQEYADEWQALAAAYPLLPPDDYLPGGAHYRFRRYDRFHFEPVTGSLDLLPHENYFQSTDINAVTGGIVRQFAPLTPEIAENPFLHALIRWNFAQFPMRHADWGYGAWQVDAHLISVVSTPTEVGHPTPEGVHRDGAEFVTVHLALLDNADGGYVTLYDEAKEPLECFRLNHVMDSYLFEDAVLWHGVASIHPHDEDRPAKRGILTFDYHFLG